MAQVDAMVSTSVAKVEAVSPNCTDGCVCMYPTSSHPHGGKSSMYGSQVEEGATADPDIGYICLLQEMLYAILASLSDVIRARTCTSSTDQLLPPSSAHLRSRQERKRLGHCTTTCPSLRAPRRRDHEAACALSKAGKFTPVSIIGRAVLASCGDKPSVPILASAPATLVLSLLRTPVRESSDMADRRCSCTLVKLGQGTW